MRPVKLELKGIYQHTDLVYNYETGVIVVCGENGTGKTHFTDPGQFYAWTGCLPKGEKKKDAESWEKSEGKTRVHFMDSRIMYVLERSVKGAAVSLKWQDLDGVDQELTDRAEIDEKLSKIYGCPVELLRDINVISQNTLMDVLNMTQSRMLEYMQQIIQGLGKAEDIRESTQKFLNSHPVSVVPLEDIEKAEEEVVFRKRKITEAENTEKEAREKAASTREGSEMFLAVKNRSVLDGSQDEMIKAAEQKLQEAVEEKTAAEKALNDTEEPVERSQKMIPSMLAEYIAELKKEPSLKESLEKAEARLAQRQPVYEEQIKEYELIQAKLSHLVELKPKLRNTVDKLKERLDLAHKGKCPTCLQDFIVEQDKIDKAKEKLAESEKALEDCSHSIVEVRDTIQKLKRAVDNLQQGISTDSAEIASKKKDLERIEDIRKRYSMTLEEAVAEQEYVHSIQQLKMKYANLQQEFKAAENKVERARLTVEKYRGTDFIAREEYDRLQALHNAHLTAVENMNQAASDTQSAKFLLQKAEEALSTLREQSAKNRRKEEAVKLLTETRDLFHKNQLPKIAIRSTVHRLNRIMQKLLSGFNMPFTAYFDDDFNLLCDFPAKGQSEKPARSALSGGQKVAVGIAFHLAKAELVGNRFPIFVMDEPTAFLSAKSIESLADVLRKLKSVMEKDMYFMVPTHEPRLTECATSVYEM